MPKTFDQLQTQARATNTLVASLRNMLRAERGVSRAAILNRLSMILSRYDHSINADSILEAIFDDKSKPVLWTGNAADVANETRTPEQQVIAASYRAWADDKNADRAGISFVNWIRMQNHDAGLRGKTIAEMRKALAENPLDKLGRESIFTDIERHAHDMAMDRTDEPSQHASGPARDSFRHD